MQSVTLSLLETIFGSVSAAACLSVIVTYFMFTDIRSLRFVELVFYVSVNDMIASIGVALGRVPNGSIACWFQGLSTNINYLSSIMWTTVITIQIWMVVMRGETLHDMTYIHIICWGFPVLVALLPLTTNTYGSVEPDSDWCFIGKLSHSPRWGVLVWELLSFYVWIWSAILINTFLLIQTRVALSRILAAGLADAAASKKILHKISKLIWYPRILMFCWLASTITDISALFKIDKHTTQYHAAVWLSAILAVSQGWLLALAFFAMNPIIRYKWIGWWTNKPTVYQNTTTLAYTFNIENDSSVRDSSYSIYSVVDEPDYIYHPSLANRISINMSIQQDVSRRSSDSSVEFRTYSTASNKVLNPIQSNVIRESEVPSNYYRIPVGTPTTHVSSVAPVSPGGAVGVSVSPTSSTKESTGESVKKDNV